MQDNPSAAAPCRVRKIFIRGLQHTRESVVRNELARLDQASTLGEIGDGCLEAAAGLQSLNIFEGCDVLVDSAPRSSDETPLADIIVTVNEKKRLTSAATGVSTQGGEGSMDANVTVRNALGYAERLDLNMELGQQKSSTFKLSATRPRFQGTDAELTADVSKCVHSAPDHARPFPPRPSLLLLAGTHTHPGAPLCPLSSHSTSAPPRLPSAFPPPPSASLRLPSASLRSRVCPLRLRCAISHVKHSSFVEKLLGGSLSARFGSAHGPFGMPSLGYSLESRDVCKLPPGTASWSILQQRGLSLKSCVIDTLARTPKNLRLGPWRLCQPFNPPCVQTLQPLKTARSRIHVYKHSSL